VAAKMEHVERAEVEENLWAAWEAGRMERFKNFQILSYTPLP